MLEIGSVQDWANLGKLISIFFIYSFFIDFGNLAYSLAYKYRYNVKYTKKLMQMKFINHKRIDIINRYKDYLKFKENGSMHLKAFNTYGKVTQFRIALLNLKNIRKGGF